MKVKIEIQNLWQKGFDWNTQIDQRCKDSLDIILPSLDQLCDIKVVRWTSSNPSVDNLQLVAFCGSCDNGYTAVVYSWAKSEAAHKIPLLVAKGGVAPLKARVNQKPEVCTIPNQESVRMI